MFSLFRNRFIQAIILSEMFMLVGIWVRNFAVLLYVVEMTHGDAVAVSMISFAEFAPIFIFSFIGGAFADRWKPKRTMIYSDLLSAVTIFGVLGALLLGSWQIIFFVTLFSAILSQFSQPAGLKLFKMHVPSEHLQESMSLYQTIFSLFMVFGPVLGTFVYETFGIYVSIAIMGSAFLLSAAALTFLPPDKDMNVDKANLSSIVQEVVAGFRYVLSRKVLKLLGGCFLAAGLGVGLITPIFIFLITEQLGLPKEYLQWFMMVNGIGMILGGILAIGLAKKISPQQLLMAGLFFIALGTSIVGLSKILWLTMIFQFISGLALPFIHTGINTLMLQNTESQYVGRVNGIFNPLFFGTMLISMSLLGFLKKLFPLMMLYQMSAILFLISLVIILPLYRSPQQQREGGNE